MDALLNAVGETYSNAVDNFKTWKDKTGTQALLKKAFKDAPQILNLDGNVSVSIPMFKALGEIAERFQQQQAKTGTKKDTTTKTKKDAAKETKKDTATKTKKDTTK